MTKTKKLRLIALSLCLFCVACAEILKPRGYRAELVTHETGACSDPRQGIRLDTDKILFVSKTLTQTTHISEQTSNAFKLLKAVDIPKTAFFSKADFFEGPDISVANLVLIEPQEEILPFVFMQSLEKIAAPYAEQAIPSTGFTHRYAHSAAYNFVRSRQGQHQHVFVYGREKWVPVSGDSVTALFLTTVTEDIPAPYTNEQLWQRRLQLTEAVNCLLYR
jgi:hypothetical protein